MIMKSRIIRFLVIIFAIILSDFIYFEIAALATDRQIILDENLKPGMALKDAFELLGPPETMITGKTGTVVIPYDELGLSIEIMNNGNVVEAVHIKSSFQGEFSQGIKIGADYQKILSAYDQPDIMTKEIIEYFDKARIFKINEGRLSGADIYAAESTLYHRTSSEETGKFVSIPEEVSGKVNEEALREELREEVREEVRQELSEEAGKGLSEDADVFDLYGFKVIQTSGGVVITEIRPGSAAEHGNLKVGEPVRKAFYDGAGKLNIYTVKGLEKILRRAISKNKKIINILQDKNYYYKVEIPGIK